MSRADTVLVEDGPLERRIATLADGVVWDLVLDHGRSLARGARHWGRAGAKAPGGIGVFVRLLHGPDGLLPEAGLEGKWPAEGAAIAVEIVQEARGGKGPRLALLPPGAAPPPAVPALLAPAPDPVETLAAHGEGAAIIRRTAEDPDPDGWSALLDAAMEEAADPVVPLPGGARLIVEPTEAVVAVDVDSGAATSHKTVAFAAVRALARQLRLRGLAGLVVLDPPRLRREPDRRGLLDELRRAISADPWPVEVLGHTRGGLVEMTRERRGPTLAALASSETGQAATALRRLLREARGATRPPALLIPPTIAAEVARGLDEARARLKLDVTVRVEPGFGPGRVEVRLDG